MKELSIQVKGINKSFRNKREKSENIVLKDISFDIKEGEFITLLGPSGCGKSTTLNIIAGFLEADSGSVLVNGKEVTKPGPDRAFVFQGYALFPWMKVGENITYPMKLQKLPKTERREKLDALLEMVQLKEYENAYIHELSGGMKQRVALLRALACDPEVLLMDEPLGALDFQMRQQLQEQLEIIVKENEKTALMVTHDVDEAVYLSDRVIVMSRDYGKILTDMKIDLPRPRDRKDPRYHAYSDQLSDTLSIALNGETISEGDEELLKFIKSRENIQDSEQID